MKLGLVSIITPIYNSEKYFKETYESVISQTYSNWEWFIIDDCSKDGSYDLVVDLVKDDKRIHVIKLTENVGTAKARNEGLKLANGQYITFIDADDMWNKDFLEKQVEFMKNTGCPFVFSSYLMKGSKGRKEIIVPKRVTYKNILKTNSVGCLTAMYDASILGVELMNESLRKREDWVCWLQLLKRTPFALGNPECLGTYRLLPTAKSHKKSKLIKYQWRVYRKVEKVNFFKSLYYLMCWAIGGVKKYRGIKA